MSFTDDTTIFEIPIVDELKASDLPTLEDYALWNNVSNRTFFIDYDIDDSFLLVELSKIIIHINRMDKDTPVEELKPITLYIYSYGGDLHQANYFADLIMASRTPVITVSMGVTMSAGFSIFLAGHKRYAFKHSQMLIHSGSGSFSGTAEQIRAAQENYTKLLDEAKAYILEKTTIDEETFEKNRDKDWYLTSEDFVKYNIVDGIINKITDIM